MHLLSAYRLFARPSGLLKIILLSSAALSTVILTGCASKPQVNNTTRYATAPGYYTVRSGDTLSAIAARYGLGYVSVAEMNDIAPPYRIYVGQSLRLKTSASRPTTSTQAVTQAAPIQRQTVATYPAKTTTAPAVKNLPTVPVASSKASALRWVKPSMGAVIQNFSLANNIKGIRYAGNVGDAIYAAADGQVVYAADGLKEYGNLILIKLISSFQARV